MQLRHPPFFWFGAAAATDLGAGVEFPISVHLRMRLDYSRTGYSRYTIDYGIGVDDFDNSENLFRIGISYTF